MSWQQLAATCSVTQMNWLVWVDSLPAAGEAYSLAFASQAMHMLLAVRASGIALPLPQA